MERAPQQDIDFMDEIITSTVPKLDDVRHLAEMYSQDKVSYYGLTMMGMVAVRDSFIDVAKTLAIHAVQNNAMTRRDAAELLHVHPITISRWLTAETVEAPPEP